MDDQVGRIEFRTETITKVYHNEKLYETIHEVIRELKDNFITIDETIRIIKAMGGINIPEHILELCMKNKLGKMTNDGYMVDKRELNFFLDGLAQ